jgi:hypothetical protein
MYDCLFLNLIIVWIVHDFLILNMYVILNRTEGHLSVGERGMKKRELSLHAVNTSMLSFGKMLTPQNLT